MSFSCSQVACFGSTKYTAFLKALMSAGFRVPKEGSGVLLGMQKSFLPHFLPIGKRLSLFGYQVGLPTQTVVMVRLEFVNMVVSDHPRQRCPWSYTLIDKLKSHNS